MVLYNNIHFIYGPPLPPSNSKVAGESVGQLQRRQYKRLDRAQTGCPGPSSPHQGAAALRSHPTDSPWVRLITKIQKQKQKMQIFSPPRGSSTPLPPQRAAQHRCQQQPLGQADLHQKNVLVQMVCCLQNRTEQSDSDCTVITNQ